MYALVKDGKAIEGMSKIDLIQNTKKFIFDVRSGHLYYRNKKDSITYNPNEYTIEEMMYEMAKRGVELMVRSGWTIYKQGN